MVIYLPLICDKAIVIYVVNNLITGGKEDGDDEPDKMAIAIGRFGRLKRWIKGQIVKGFVALKNKIIRGIRGPSTEENDIALEVNPEMDLFQVSTCQNYTLNR